MDPRETEGFDEGLDLEYHDASEDPNVLEPESVKREPGLSHGGCGSSSLRECIELLANTERNAPAALHSGANKDSKSSPPHDLPSPFLGHCLFWDPFGPKKCCC